jgi:hypothetical protein
MGIASLVPLLSWFRNSGAQQSGSTAVRLLECYDDAEANSGEAIMTRPLLGEYRNQILELAARHGACNVRVFGSVARGEARPDSDVDFLVECRPDPSPFSRAVC